MLEMYEPYHREHGLRWQKCTPSSYVESAAIHPLPLAGRTFIKALESSPVHCLKPRPTGKRLKPENGGASDILPYLSHVKQGVQRDPTFYRCHQGLLHLGVFREC